MNNIFSNEEQVILKAEELLALNQFSSEADALKYKNLLDEYSKLLKQMMTVVKLSDIIQLELKTISEKLEVTSSIDALTGLYNRRHFNDIYQKEWKNAVRSKSSLALLMIDIDFFKKYNDTYGHLQGDECLKTVSQGISKTLNRPRDTVSRFGGEEFVVLLPETDIKGACLKAGEMLEAISDLNLEHSALPGKKLTVSIGVAAIIPEDKNNTDSLLKMIDSALYSAKNAGRNCYKTFSPEISK